MNAKKNYAIYDQGHLLAKSPEHLHHAVANAYMYSRQLPTHVVCNGVKHPFHLSPIEKQEMLGCLILDCQTMLAQLHQELQAMKGGAA